MKRAAKSRLRLALIASSALLALLLRADFATADIVSGSGVSGRFVRVTNLLGVNRQLAIGEIEAFNFGTTPSNGAGLSTNEILASFEADGATSGYTLGHGSTPAPVNNALESGGDTYNAAGVDNFYIADLGSTQNLGSIRVWQRVDCCNDRLSDLSVSILADNGGVPGAAVFTAQYGRPPGVPSFGNIDVFSSRLIRPGGPAAVGTETQGSAGGRFIRVQNNGLGFRALHIGEIEAFLAGVTPGGSYDNANDVALSAKGATWESNTGNYDHGNPGNSIDGLASGGADAFTRTGTGAELIIDLGQIRDVGTLRVWQRADGCCDGRLQDFSVSLLDDDGNGNPGAVLNTQSFPGQPATSSFASFTLPAFTNTKYTIESIDTLQIELNAAANTSDLLQIGAAGTGALAIKPGSTLSVTNLGGLYTQFETFNILDFGSVSGTFSTVNLPTLNTPAWFWDTSQLYTTGQITAVPEPSSLATMLVGGMMLWFVGRKRGQR